MNVDRLNADRLAKALTHTECAKAKAIVERLVGMEQALRAVTEGFSHSTSAHGRAERIMDVLALIASAKGGKS